MLKYYSILLSILILGGCSLTDNDQPIPSYLVIDEVDVFTTDAQGVATHNITDVWVNADNELIGVFELPIRVPILVNNPTTEITLFPGFRNNGETSRSFSYELLKPVSYSLEIAPGDAVELSPIFSYTENAKFDFIESFENSSHIFTRDIDGNENTGLEISDESAVAGIRSGKLSLNDTISEIGVSTTFSYERLQNAGRDSYLEMDYKCDIRFYVGVIYVQEGSEFTRPLLAVNPKEDWNKLYVDFTDILTSPQIVDYRVFFATDLGLSQNKTGDIFLDNLKFVHF